MRKGEREGEGEERERKRNKERERERDREREREVRRQLHEQPIKQSFGAAAAAAEPRVRRFRSGHTCMRSPASLSSIGS